MTVFHRVTEGKLGSHDGCTIEDEVSQEFLDRIPGGLFRYRADDEGGTIDYVSRDVLELFGCATYEEFCSITGHRLIGMVWWLKLDRKFVKYIHQFSVYRLVVLYSFSER